MRREPIPWEELELERVFARRFKKQCQARCAESGVRCGLLEGHKEFHASGRGQFRVVAAEGQTRFANVEQLELAAGARNEVALAV